MKKWHAVLLVFLVLTMLFVAGCGGGAKPAATTAPAAAPANDTSQGKALVESKCTVCHPMSQITTQKKDQAGWQTTVERMVGKGAQLTADQQKLVVEYLVSAFPK
jgi:hypothetical protein